MLLAVTLYSLSFWPPDQALSENVFIRADIAFSALETFCLMVYRSLLTHWSVILSKCLQGLPSIVSVYH